MTAEDKSDETDTERIGSMGIIRFPGTSAGAGPLKNLSDIIDTFSKKTIIISGNETLEKVQASESINIIRVDHKPGENKFFKIINYIITQIRISFQMLKYPKIESYIFFYTDILLIPILVAKLMRKKILIALMADPIGYGKGIEGLDLILDLCYSLSHAILIYSENLIKEWNLDRYKKKIKLAHEHIIDTDKFCKKTNFSEREYDIGYIGRFDKEKNVMGFLRAISLLLKHNKLKQNTKIFLGGGQEEERVLKYIENQNLTDIIDFHGWIKHNELPDHLNNIKLLVIPSHTEGLPNIMLEAMACGTPVLASSVGSIPDLIDDNYNGFLLKDNSPKSIAKRLIEIMDYDEKKMKKVTKSSSTMVNKNFNFETVKNNYKEAIFDVIGYR